MKNKNSKTKQSRDESLLPCPFCGVDVELTNKTCIDFLNQESQDIWDIQCNTEGCYLEDGADWFEEKDVIIEKWNSRCGDDAMTL